MLLKGSDEEGAEERWDQQTAVFVKISLEDPLNNKDHSVLTVFDKL